MKTTRLIACGNKISMMEKMLMTKRKSEILEVHEDKDKAHALRGEKHHCDVDGLLRLNGTINVEKERIYMNCRRVVCSRRCLQSVCAFAFLSSLSTGVVVRSEALDKALRVGLQGARCTICL